MNDNDAILAVVDSLGGDSVWEDDVFAVNLMEPELSDDQALVLCGLVGVQQIAINASRLAFPTLRRLAEIPLLESLVLGHAALTPQQFDELSSVGPEVEQVNE